MKEEWKFIIIKKGDKTYDFTNKYQVSNLGNVRSLNYNNTGKIKIMNPHKRKDGYYEIGLSRNAKSRKFLIHRLVATMFLPNPENLLEVNHKDEDKTNNVVDNLEWCDRIYNVNYGTSSKRKREKLQGRVFEDSSINKMREKASERVGIKVRCVETGQIFNSYCDAARWCGLKSAGNIISSCRTKKCAGRHPTTKQKLHWEKVEW